jgi:hypothetical protein
MWNTTASEDGIGTWTCSVAVADGKVFVGKSGAYFGYSGTYALDAFTGNVIWSYPEGGSSPAVADGMVFTIGGGKVYAFNEVFRKGDINRDSSITVEDAVMALEMAVRGEWREEADVNRDGAVTSLDALMILQAATS